MPNTDETSGWLKLLSSLSDDELSRYGEIARDQHALEYGNWWGQIGCMLASIAALVWGSWRLVVSGMTAETILAMVAAVVLGYWPWRKVRTRRLWQGHCEAVAREQARRVTRAG